MVFVSRAVFECFDDVCDLELRALGCARVKDGLGPDGSFVRADLGDHVPDAGISAVIGHQCVAVQAESCLHRAVRFDVIFFCSQEVSHNWRQFGRTCLESEAVIFRLISAEFVELRVQVVLVRFRLIVCFDAVIYLADGAALEQSKLGIRAREFRFLGKSVDAEELGSPVLKDL